MPLANFSNQEISTLRDILRAGQSVLRAARLPGVKADTHSPRFAPEVYIAKPQVDIPALDVNTTGTAIDDEPGSGDCDIYRIVDGVITPVTGFEKLVYNLSDQTVEADSWLTIIRTKQGVWVVPVAVPPTRDLIAAEGQETHPGRGIRFTVKTGVEDGDGWDYTGEEEDCIDWRDVTDYPTGSGHTGQCFRRNNGLLEVVSWDCDVPTGTGTGT